MDSNSVTGGLYGYLVLDAHQAHPFNFPMFPSDRMEIGNHQMLPSGGTLNNLDFLHGAHSTDFHKVYVPNRGTTISVFQVGDPSMTSTQLVHSLLNINDSIDSEGATYLQVLHSKIFSPVGRFCTSISVTSSQPKLALLSSDMPIYLCGFSSQEVLGITWSNDPGLIDRMREQNGTRLYYYRMPTLLNGTLLIQTRFLRSSIRRWTADRHDKLKLMNALESWLQRKTLHTGGARNTHD
jgi:hypothetical protein